MNVFLIFDILHFLEFLVKYSNGYEKLALHVFSANATIRVSASLTSGV